MTNSSPWKDPPMLLIGKPSISMGHLYHGYVSHNQRVMVIKWDAVNPTKISAQFSSEFPVSFPTVVLGFIHFGPAAMTISIAMKKSGGWSPRPARFEDHQQTSPQVSRSEKTGTWKIGRKSKIVANLVRAKLRSRPQIKTHILPENGTVTASLCSNWRTGRTWKDANIFAEFEWQTSDITILRPFLKSLPSP